MLPFPPDKALAMPYFKIGEVLTTKSVFERAMQDIEIQKYFPDNYKANYVKREFIFSVIHYVNRNLYKELEKIKIAEQKKRKKKTIANYALSVSSKYKEKLKKSEKLDGNTNIFKLYFFINNKKIFFDI